MGMGDSFDISEYDRIEFYIRCDNIEIFRNCLIKVFSMGYYWWADKSQDICLEEYTTDTYIVCYSGDKTKDIPLNISVSDGEDDTIEHNKVVSGLIWLRKDKLKSLKSVCK